MPREFLPQHEDSVLFIFRTNSLLDIVQGQRGQALESVTNRKRDMLKLPYVLLQ